MPPNQLKKSSRKVSGPQKRCAFWRVPTIFGYLVGFAPGQVCPVVHSPGAPSSQAGPLQNVPPDGHRRQQNQQKRIETPIRAKANARARWLQTLSSPIATWPNLARHGPNHLRAAGVRCVPGLSDVSQKCISKHSGGIQPPPGRMEPPPPAFPKQSSSSHRSDCSAQRDANASTWRRGRRKDPNRETRKRPVEKKKQREWLSGFRWRFGGICLFVSFLRGGACL